MWFMVVGLVLTDAAALEAAQVQKTPGAAAVQAAAGSEPAVAATGGGGGGAGAGSPEVENPDAPKQVVVNPLPPDQGLPVAKLMEDLSSWRFWLCLLVALVCGGLGGVAYELLILQGNVERPHRAKDGKQETQFPHAVAMYLYDFGVWARVIIGGLAAVAAVWLLNPGSGLGLVAGAIVVGSAGTSVFRSLQDRLLAALALQEVAGVRATAEQQTKKVEEVLAKVKAARAIGGVQASPPAKPQGSAAPGTVDLGEVERLLVEAQAIGKTV